MMHKLALLPPSLPASVPASTNPRISGDRLDSDISLEKNSWSLALQAGFDVRLNRNRSINTKVKKVQLRGDVSMAGGQTSGVKRDPVLFGAAVGYRF
ncbi:OmpW family protein [Noviherbaspirillum soli]|uniref:OmpW family protein n=1 Tax=Noviherbaspirillum soli TaxID=1064518 RepID=UPI00188A4EF1|nr:OmpW family protein [Noviherbaspirillum soli]